jgi:O-acetylserine/cysteine efflux transporter
MQPRHVLLATVLSVVWGLNFVVIHVGLSDFPPLYMATLRFFFAALPALFLPRPAMPWRTLIALSATLFVGQFAFSFPAMAIGMPPGLMSIVLQVQAFITIGIAVVVLHERPHPRQIAGAAITLLGLVVIGTTVGVNGVNLPGLLLTLASAVSWAIGNVIIRRIQPPEMLPLVSWLSLLAVLPLLALSLLLEGPARIEVAVMHASWLSVSAVLYTAFVSSTFGYAAWAILLKLYPTPTVAPFSLLVPVTGTLSAALLLGERFGPVRLAGMALILVGLAVLVLKPRAAMRQARADG